MRPDRLAALAVLAAVHLPVDLAAARQPAQHTRLYAADTATAGAASLVTVRGSTPEELVIEYSGPEGAERTEPGPGGHAMIPWGLVTAGEAADGRLRVIGPDGATRAQQEVRVEPGVADGLRLRHAAWNPVRPAGGATRLRGRGLGADLQAELVVDRKPPPRIGSGAAAADEAGRWRAGCEVLAAGGREAVLALPEEVPDGRRARLVLSSGGRRAELPVQLYRLRLDAPRTTLREDERVTITGMLTAVTPFKGRLRLANATPEVVRMRLEPTGTSVSIAGERRGGVLVHAREGAAGGWSGRMEPGEQFAFSVPVVGRRGSPPGTPFRIDYTLLPSRRWVQDAYPRHADDIASGPIDRPAPRGGEGRAGRREEEAGGEQRPGPAEQQGAEPTGAVLEAGDLTIRMSGAVAEWAGPRREKLEKKVAGAQKRARKARAKVGKLRKRLRKLRRQRARARRQARKHAAAAERWERVAGEIVDTETYGEIVDRLGAEEAFRRAVAPNRKNARQARKRAKKARRKADRLDGKVQKLKKRLRKARRKAKKAKKRARAAERTAKKAVRRCRKEVRERREAREEACEEARAEVRRLKGEIESVRNRLAGIRKEIEKRRKQLRRMARERGSVIDGMLDPMQKLFGLLSALDSKLGELNRLTTLLLGKGVWDSPDPTNALKFGKEALEAIEDLYRHYTDPDKTGATQKGDFLQREGIESPQMVKAALQKQIRNLKAAMKRLNRLADELQDARERLRDLDCPPGGRGGAEGER